MLNKFIKLFFTFLVVGLSVSFISCEKEDPNGISKKDAKATDFLNLYGKSAKDVEASLVNFIVEKDNYDSDGNLYWVIKTKKDKLRFVLDGDEVFVTVTFKNNSCIEASLLFDDIISNGATLAALKSAYGEGSKLDDNWYDWNLPDNSVVSYFGTKLISGKKSLLVYRKSAQRADAPQKAIEKVRKNVGLDY